MHRVIKLACALVAWGAVGVGATLAAQAQDVFFYGPEPVPYVTYYAPAPAPVYYYAPPVVSYYRAPIVSYAPGFYYGPTPVYGYPRRVVVRSKTFYRGQPVRNVLRAVAP